MNMTPNNSDIEGIKRRLNSSTVTFDSYTAGFNAQSIKLNKEMNERLAPTKQLMYTAYAELQKVRLEYEIACIKSWGGTVEGEDASLESMGVWWHKNPEAMPDFDMIVNHPPYKYFSRSALLAFIVDCGLICHPKWVDKRCHLERVSLRHTPSRYQMYQMPSVLIGISAFSQVMERDENGFVSFFIENVCVRIYFEDEFGFGVRTIAGYKELLVNPENKQCHLVLYVGDVDELYDNDLITLHFPDVRSAYLHLIACQYRTKRYYQRLVKLNKGSH